MHWKILDWDSRGYYQQLNRSRRMIPNKTPDTDWFNKNTEIQKKKVYIQAIYICLLISLAQTKITSYLFS